MLSYKNNEKLLSLGVNEKYILFYQLWQELVDSRTLDTYQYRLLNILNIFEELDEIITKTLQGIYTTEHNLLCCIEETCLLFSRDETIKKHFPHQYSLFLGHIRESVAKTQDKVRLQYYLKNISNTIAPNYLSFLVADLYDDINNHNNSGIIRKTNILVSICVSNGWFPKVLGEFIYKLNGDEDEDAKWNSFINGFLNKDPEAYVVFIRQSFTTKYQSNTDKINSYLSSLGIECYDASYITQNYPDIKSNINTKYKYMAISTTAFDFYSAAYNAMNIITSPLNLFSFFDIINFWDFSGLSIWSINCTSNKSKGIGISELYGTENEFNESKSLFKQCSEIFQAPTNVNQRIYSRLNGSFSYSNIAKTSFFQEEKYINYWIALESLSRTQYSNDIASNLLDMVSSALCIRYLYKILLNFTSDCTRCEVKLYFDSLVIKTSSSDKTKITEALIKIFKDDDLFYQLQEKCKVNSLLLYRCNQIREQISSVKAMGQTLESHYQKVKWQLQRLYRIRNEIAHNAYKGNIPLNLYIEHLSDYLYTFVSEIIIFHSNYKDSDLDSIYLIIKDYYTQFTLLAKDKKNFSNAEPLIATGIISL